MDGHLVLLLVLHEKVLELVLVNLNHVVFTLVSFTFITHHFSIDIVVHHLPVIHLVAIFLFNLLLHSFDAIVLPVLVIFVIFLLHAILVNLVHVLLLLLEGLGDGGLLLWVEFVEVFDVVSLEDLLCLFLVQLHLVVDILFISVLVLMILVILILFFLDALFDLMLINILFVFTFHFIFLVDLTFGTLHLDLINDLHLLGIVVTLHVRSTLLHEGLTTVLGREVSSGNVQSIVVLR